jgi:hypothetical protein
MLHSIMIEYMFLKIRYHLPLVLVKHYICDELERPQLVVDVADVELIINLQQRFLVQITHPLLLLAPSADARDEAQVVTQDGAQGVAEFLTVSHLSREVAGYTGL